MFFCKQVLSILVLLIVLAIGQQWFDEVTKGIPRSHETYGNKFCITFLRNDPGVANSNSDLRVFITTPGNTPVDFTLTTFSRLLHSGTVLPGQIEDVEISSDLNDNFEVFPSSIRQKTIVVQTVNSSDVLQVFGYNDNRFSADIYLGIPIRKTVGITSYDYAQFSTFTTDRKSSFVVAVCDVDASTEATFFSTPAESGKVLVRKTSRGRTRINKGGSNLEISNFDTVLVSHETDLTGFRVSITDPSGVVIGHQCGQVPSDELSSDHMVEQIPPSYTWGYHFISSGLELRVTGYNITIIPRYTDVDTYVTQFCDGGKIAETLLLVKKEGLRIDIPEDVNCYFNTSRPSAVVQFAKGQQSDDARIGTDRDIGDPAMVWLPPVGQYVNRVTFYSGFTPRDCLSSYIFGEYINVIVPAAYYNSSMIKLDGNVLLNKWDRIYCSLEDICAYNATVKLSGGLHTIQHDNPDGRLSVTVYGWADEKGYMYPAGFAMDPIGEIFFSLEVTNRYVPERSGPFAVTIFRSGDINVNSSIDLMITSSSSSDEPTEIVNANVSVEGTPGNDIISQKVTINFPSGVTQQVHLIGIVQDNLDEDSEKFFVKLVKESGKFLGYPSSETLIITANEEAPETRPTEKPSHPRPVPETLPTENPSHPTENPSCPVQTITHIRIQQDESSSGRVKGYVCTCQPALLSSDSVLSDSVMR